MKKSRNSSKNPANVFAGRNLKYFMDCHDISDEQLADSFGIEKDSLLKILNGRNAISGPYNAILLKEYGCDLNFIYGGMVHSDMLIKDIGQIEQQSTGAELKKSITRAMHYLLELLENIEE